MKIAMKLISLNESYPQIPRYWEKLSFDEDELTGNEHGRFYYESENILVETYYYSDKKSVMVRVIAGDTVANGTLITEIEYDTDYPDYETILSDIESTFDDIEEKISGYGIGTIYQVIDRTCSIRDDISDMIHKKL